MSYAWIIDEDHLDIDEGREVSGPSGLKKELGEKLLAGEGEKFKIYDSDGELYYSGRIVGDFDGFEPLDDFATPNAGATDIHYKDKNGEWQPL